MISIPVAVYTPWFQWQLDLFWHNHRKLYQNDAYNKAHAIIINRNMENDPIPTKFEWNINIPHTICKPYFELFKEKQIEKLVPINIQTGLLQILHLFNDDDILEILDCDMLHFRKAPNIKPQHLQIYASNVYEDWHLLSKSKNKYIIEKYFKNNGQYYNGGFVPIILTAKTLKYIIDDWIFIHKDIVDTFKNNTNLDSEKWWAGMFSLQAACERNKIEMIDQDICYAPGFNEINPQHYIAHYSIDKIFNKFKYPNVNYNDMPNNLYYNAIKDWKNNPIPLEKKYKIFI